MTPRTTLLAAACVFALAACGGQSSDTATAGTAADQPAAETADAVAQAPTPEPAPAAAPAPTAEPAAEPTTTLAAAPASDKPAAVVADCATTIESNDAMQFNVGSITVPASCTEFKITLKHTGKMPVAAMGHNVVITTAADMDAVARDGMGAGADAGYIKAGDARVIAHTSMVGGGETTSVSFPVSKLQGAGPYEFFCSFPGHHAMMKGTIAVQ